MTTDSTYARVKDNVRETSLLHSPGDITRGIQEHGCDDGARAIIHNGLTADRQERIHIILIVKVVNNVHGKASGIFRTPAYSGMSQIPELAGAEPRHDDGNPVRLVSGKHGSVHVGFVAKFPYRPQDLLPGLFRHLSPFVQDTVNRADGDSGSLGDIVYC